MWNISYRKVGGLHWLKLGRFTFMVCLSREYRTLTTFKRTTLADMVREANGE